MTSATLVYDGDCNLCAALAAAGGRRFAAPVTIVAWQAADLVRLGIPPGDARRSVQWVGPDGARDQGHRAIARALGASRGVWRLLGFVLVAPVVSPLAALGYRLVAANRSCVAKKPL